MRLFDLTQPIGVQTPPWPSYEPLAVRYTKRLAPDGANGQVITTSNHVGTHLNGPLHFVTNGPDIASIPLERLFGPAVIVDLSDIVEDFSIYTSKQILERVEVKKHDILIINTGYHHYAWDQPEGDELRYMVRHPGPSFEFAEWCREMEFRWIGVDCASADHPMNTRIREWMPLFAKACERKLGKPLDELFPPEHYQLMHVQLLPDNIMQVENLGGDIDQLNNKRTAVGCFPWRFIGGESCICRVVAFEED